MTYDYAHLICFSPTHSSHMIGETVLQGLGTGHVSETDLTYENRRKTSRFIPESR